MKRIKDMTPVELMVAMVALRFAEAKLMCRIDHLRGRTDCVDEVSGMYDEIDKLEKKHAKIEAELVARDAARTAV